MFHTFSMKTKKHTTPEQKLKIVNAFLKGGPVGYLAEVFEVTSRSIYYWVEKYKSKNTLDSDEEETRGRPPKITATNGKKLLKIIKRPASDFGFETDLWNTSRLKIICKRELNIKTSKMAIWRFLKKFTQSFKKVQKQYYETDIDAQKEWKKKVVTKIKMIIKKHRAILYFTDESNIQLSPVMGKSWGPIGEKIVHKVTGNRGSISAISAISNDGRLLFNLFDGGKRFKSADIINFLGQMLAHHKKRHLVVVLDRAPCHRSKMVQEFIKSQSRLHVFYLPARSPELNPDEQVWAHLKNHEIKSHQETNLKGLKRLTRKKLNRLAKDSEKIHGIFKRCNNAYLYL
ncbi:MAG: hypothetical protein A2298_02585 [Gammaproteobacteria bacterium RIFOXYB2_FULL_38_6]|nr:MAG: hypothetical protein A2298_02585 [Gammaproteobacteria bacterium RIFOXYB2_FULL_38_6]